MELSEELDKTCQVLGSKIKNVELACAVAAVMSNIAVIVIIFFMLVVLVLLVNFFSVAEVTWPVTFLWTRMCHVDIFI